MSYEIAWILTSDLTDTEIVEIKEVVRRIIQPGLQAMSLRKRNLSALSLLSKLTFFLFVQKMNATYYARQDSAAFASRNTAIAPSAAIAGASEVLIPYKAGETRANALGAQQCLTLATIATLTDKVRLLEVEASSLDDIKVKLALIEKHAGMKFKNLGTMLQDFGHLAAIRHF